VRRLSRPYAGTVLLQIKTLFLKNYSDLLSNIFSGNDIVICGRFTTDFSVDFDSCSAVAEHFG